MKLEVQVAVGVTIAPLATYRRRMTLAAETKGRPFLRNVVACAYMGALGCGGLAAASIVQHGSTAVAQQDNIISAFIGSLAKVQWWQRHGHTEEGTLRGCSVSMVASVKVT